MVISKFLFLILSICIGIVASIVFYRIYQLFNANALIPTTVDYLKSILLSLTIGSIYIAIITYIGQKKIRLILYIINGIAININLEIFRNSSINNPNMVEDVFYTAMVIITSFVLSYIFIRKHRS